MQRALPAVDNLPDRYKRIEIETASPAKLLIVLYDAAIQRCTSAAESMRRRELEPAHRNLLKAQDILTELMAALDFDAPDAPVRELFALYDYMHRTLVQANVRKEAEPIVEVGSILTQLRETWVEAAFSSDNREQHEEEDPLRPPPRSPRLDVQT